MRLIALASALLFMGMLPTLTAQQAGCFRLKAYNYPSYFWGLQGNEVYIQVSTATTLWRFVDGLDGKDSVSFASCERSNIFLTVSNGLLNAAPSDGSVQFAQLSSFIINPSKWFPNTVAIESAASRNFFLRHQNYRLKLNAYENTRLYQADASFILTRVGEFLPPLNTCIKLFSYNFPQNVLASNLRIDIKDDSFRFIPANISSSSTAVNVESCVKPGSFLVAPLTGDLLSLDTRQLQSDWALRAAWVIRSELWYVETVALESLKTPGSFIRHQNSVLKVQPNDNTDLFKNDGSWIPISPSDSTVTTLPTSAGDLDTDDSLVLFYTFDEGRGNVLVDRSKSRVNGTVGRMATWVKGITGPALAFNGSAASTVSVNFNTDRIVSNFTVSLWMKPTAEHEIDFQSKAGTNGVSGQKYVLSPVWAGAGKSGFGISAGSNGISVYAHTADYMPALLTFPRIINDWVFVTVTVSNDVPALYINGVYAQLGEKSQFPLYFKLESIGTYVYGNYEGLLDELRVYNRILSQAEISSIFSIGSYKQRCFVAYAKSNPTLGWSTNALLVENPTDKFRVTDGLLGDGSVSIESCDKPNSFFIVQGDLSIKLVVNDNSAAFAKQSAFIIRQDVNGYYTFESVAYPGRFFHHRANLYGSPILDVVFQKDSLADDMSFITRYTDTLSDALPCDGITNYQDEVARFHFDEGYGNIVNDQSFGSASGTLTNGPTWVTGKIGMGLRFDGSISNPNLFQSVIVNDFWFPLQKSFTVSFWARPSRSLPAVVYSQKNTGVEGVSGLRYVIQPVHGAGIDPTIPVAGFGVSVASNGVTVVSHAANYMPPLLVWAAPIVDWTHITVVVNDSVPFLYINGRPVLRGVRSQLEMNFRLSGFGSYIYGAYGGDLDEVHIFNRPLLDTEVLAKFQKQDAQSSWNCATFVKGDTGNLTCPGDQVIDNVELARYGGLSGNCSAYQLSSCSSDYAALRLEQICLGKKSCIFDIITELQGGPCYATGEKLYVQYSCRPNNLNFKVNCLNTSDLSKISLTCPAGLLVGNVDWASLGTPTGTCGSFQVNPSCHAPASIDVLENQCLGLTNCTIPNLNELITVPTCPGTISYRAQYTCQTWIPPFVKCTTSGEYSNTYAYLSCPAGEKITEIIRSSYGTPTGSCDTFSLSSCHAVNSDSIIRKLCVGQNSCTVQASNTIFGDPCFGTVKWLHVQYACSSKIQSSTCKSLTTCGAGQQEVIAPTPTSDRVCQACPANTYKLASAPTNARCQRATNCILGTTYEVQPPTATSDRVCKPVSFCAANRTFASAPATLTSNTVCSPCSVCPNFSIQLSACTPTSDTKCASCNDCKSGEYLVRACSQGQDNVCASCASACQGPNQYLNGTCEPTRAVSCGTYTTCTANQYESSAPTRTSDRVCTPLTVCRNFEFQIFAPNATSDRVCQPLTSCKIGEREAIAPTATSDRVCAPCPAGTAGADCAPCPSGRYVPAGSISCDDPAFICPKGTVDLDGNPATPCQECDGEAEFMDEDGTSGACKRTTRCVLGFTFQTIPATASSDRICEAVTVCSSTQFISVPATLLSDVVCKNCSVCPRNHFQIAACTPTTDTVCRGCSGCRQGQYLLTPCGSSDTFCGDCSVGCLRPNSFYDGVCDPSLPLNCTRYTECGANQFEAIAGTKTSDRICRPVKECDLGEQETQAPTSVSDRVCSPCPAGTGGKGCAKCSPGRYVPEGAVDCNDSQYLCPPGTVDDDSDASTSCQLCNGVTDFQDVSGGIGTCKPVSNCVLGETYETTAPTSTSDRVCSPVTKCGANQFLAVPATLTSDASCSVCSACPRTHFLLANCTATKDTICSNCKPCSLGEYILEACDDDSDTVCASCEDGCKDPNTFFDSVCDPSKTLECKPFKTCGPNEYQSIPGTKTSDRVCLQVRTCQTGEREVFGPTNTTDRVCGPCRPGTGGPGCGRCSPGSYVSEGAVTCDDPKYLCAVGTTDADSDPSTLCLPCDGRTRFQDQVGQFGPCKPVRTCKFGERQLSPPTPSTDRVCIPCETLDTPGCRACRPGNQIITDTSGPSPLDICTSCIFSETFDNDMNSTTPCVPVSVCKDTEEEIASPTLLLDRICQPCKNGGKSYVQVRNYNKRVCVKECAADEFESQRPTETSDRVCIPTVSFLINGDFSTVIGTSNSSKANELRTKIREAFVANGVPDDSFADIAFSEGSIVVVIATWTRELANQMLDLVKQGKITVNLNGKTFDASTDDPAASTASKGFAMWIIGVIVGATFLVIIVIFIVVKAKRSARTTLDPSFMYSTKEGTLEASGFSNPLYDGQKAKSVGNPLYKEDGYFDVNPGVANYDNPKEGARTPSHYSEPGYNNQGMDDPSYSEPRAFDPAYSEPRAFDPAYSEPRAFDRAYDRADSTDPAYMAVSGKVAYDVANGDEDPAYMTVRGKGKEPAYDNPSVRAGDSDPAYMTVRGKGQEPAYDNPTISGAGDHGYMDASVARKQQDSSYMAVAPNKKVIAVKPLHDEEDPEYIDVGGSSDL